jgi:hypothetical protein
MDNVASWKLHEEAAETTQALESSNEGKNEVKNLIVVELRNARGPLQPRPDREGGRKLSWSYGRPELPRDKWR